MPPFALPSYAPALTLESVRYTGYFRVKTEGILVINVFFHFFHLQFVRDRSAQVCPIEVVHAVWIQIDPAQEKYMYIKYKGAGIFFERGCPKYILAS